MDADTEVAQRLTQIQNLIALAAQAKETLETTCQADMVRLLKLANEVRRDHLLKGEARETLTCLESLEKALADALAEEDGSHSCGHSIAATLSEAHGEVRDLRRQMTPAAHHQS